MDIVKEFITSGFENDLRDNKQRSLKAALSKCNELRQHIDIHHKIPLITDKDPIVKRLGTWLVNQRSMKSGKRLGYFHDECEVYMTEHGYPNIFDKQKRYTIEASCNLIIENYCNSNTLPKQRGNTAHERNLYQILAKVRNDKYPITLKRKLMRKCEQLKIPFIFETVIHSTPIPSDRKQIAFELFYEFLNYCIKYKDYPKVNQKCTKYERIAKWYIYVRRAIRRTSSTTTFYDEFDTIATSHGFPNIFTNDWRNAWKHIKGIEYSNSESTNKQSSSAYRPKHILSDHDINSKLISHITELKTLHPNDILTQLNTFGYDSYDKYDRRYIDPRIITKPISVEFICRVLSDINDVD
jgi:hypothetical protein